MTESRIPEADGPALPPAGNQEGPALPPAGNQEGPSLPPALREWIPFVFLAAALLAFVLVAPIRRLGDGSDYSVMTESLWFDHDLRYTEADLARHLALKPYDFQSPAGLHTLPGPGGGEVLGAHHSFYYSLAAIPWYAVFGYRGFLLLNGACLFAFALALYLHLRRHNPAATAWAWLLLAIVFSAAWTYVAWIHTEVFYLALLGGFMLFWERDRHALAALCLGLAAAAQPILVLLAVPFLVLTWAERRSPRLLATMVAVMAAAAAPQVAYNLWAFGIVHPLLANGEMGFGHLGLAKYLRTWLDPAAGIVWFYPAVVVAAFDAPRTPRTWLVWSGVLAMILAGGVPSNWYNHQVGVRYGIYAFAVVPFLVREVSLVRLRSVALWAAAIFVATGLAVAPISNSAGMNVDTKLFLPYRLARALPFYREDRAVLWNRVQEVGPGVRMAPLFPDLWLPGGEEVVLLVARATPAPLALTFAPWPAAAGPLQELRIEAPSGRHRFELAPGAPRTVEIPVTAPDLAPYPGWLVLRVRAAGWSPRLAVPGSSDLRRLGVRLVRLTQGGDVLYAR